MDQKKIHLVGLMDVVTKEVTWHTEAATLRQQIGSFDKLIGHNLLGFDKPILEQLWKIKIQTKDCIDTLILSRLLNPGNGSEHSLESWGKRLGSLKGDFTDYDGPAEGESYEEWFERMRVYCKQDLRVTASLYRHLDSELTRLGYSDQSRYLEHAVAAIIDEQERTGWAFAVRTAQLLLARLEHEQMEQERVLVATFPPMIKPMKRVPDKVIPFNPGSRQQAAKHLVDMGWKPPKLTPGGAPQLDESTLKDCKIPEAKLMLRYLQLEKIIGMVRSWINAYDEKTGRIYGSMNTLGTVNRRASHNNPNLGQIPNSEHEFGLACRELFIVEKGYKLVGCDAAGLQLRALAHYMADPEYIEAVCNGDIHTHHLNACNGLVKTRGDMKTTIYAYLFGAMDPKLGATNGGGAALGKQIRAALEANVPALGKLQKKVQKHAAKGRLPNPDGGFSTVRQIRTALNALLMSCEAIIMKQAMVLAHEALQGYDAVQVGWIHDEFQWEVKAEQVEEVARILEWSIKEAGVVLGIRCPLKGEAKIGDNWRQTH